MKRPKSIASICRRDRALLPVFCMLGLMSLSGCASSFQGITIGAQRVAVLRSDVILQCQSGPAPFACREVTPKDKAWTEVDLTPSMHAPTEVLRIPDGIALLLRGMKVVVKMSDETVLRGTVGEQSSAESLVVVTDSKEVSVVRWSGVSSIIRDPGVKNPYD